MRIRFRRIKDITAVPIDMFIRTVAILPEGTQRMIFGGIGMLLKGWYFSPMSHARRTMKNFCRITGRTDARGVYFRMMDNMALAARLYGRLMRKGSDAILNNTTFAGDTLQQFHAIQEKYGAAIFIVPHCSGSVLSSAAVGKQFNSIILVRESKSERRSQIMRRYFEKLAVDLLFVRRTEPATVVRRILRALNSKKMLFGTTDLARPAADTVEATIFGQRVTLPGWPARFSARLKAPIVPTYVRMENERILISIGEPFVEEDLGIATQRWARFFEENFRRYPSDWIFMLDKRWSKVLATAASESPKTDNT